MRDTCTILSSARDDRGGVLVIRCSRLRRAPVKIIPVVGHSPSVLLHPNDVRVKFPEEWNCRALTLASAGTFGALTYPAAPVYVLPRTASARRNRPVCRVYILVFKLRTNTRNNVRGAAIRIIFAYCRAWYLYQKDGKKVGSRVDDGGRRTSRRTLNLGSGSLKFEPRNFLIINQRWLGNFLPSLS